MSDIFREVDDALQKDKAARFWKEYGPVLIMAAVLLVLSTAATTAYRAWDKSRDQTETAKLLNALQDSEPAPALLEAAQDTRAGQAAIARLISASMMAQAENLEQAAATYQSIYQDPKTPAPLDSLARILFVRASVTREQNANPEDMIGILKPVLDESGNPYEAQARLDAALISGGLQKNYGGALAYLAPLTERENVQQSLKDNAAKLTQFYAQKQAQDKTETPDTTQ